MGWIKKYDLFVNGEGIIKIDYLDRVAWIGNSSVEIVWERKDSNGRLSLDLWEIEESSGMIVVGCIYWICSWLFLLLLAVEKVLEL